MSTLYSQLGTTVCSDFSDSLEDGAFDTLEKAFDESTGPEDVSPEDGAYKVDRDDFGQVGELHQKVLVYMINLYI